MMYQDIVKQLSDFKNRIFPRPFERLALESFTKERGGMNKLVGCEIGV
jgi:hypothetical protein